MKIKNIGNKIRNILISNFYRENTLIDYIDAKEIMKDDSRAILLDVRSRQEYDEYHLEGAICIPTFELQAKVENIIEDKNQIIIVYCQSGGRSKKSAKLLNKIGYLNIYEISGGINNI